MKWGDISSFDPGWDFSTDLHTAAWLGQLTATSALDWNKLEFVKLQGYGFGFLIDVIHAAMCRDSLKQGGSTTLSIQYIIFSFLALSTKLHITHGKVLLV